MDNEVTNGTITKKKKRWVFIVVVVFVVVVLSVILSLIVFNRAEGQKEPEQKNNPISDKYLTDLGYDVASLSYDELIEIGQKYKDNKDYDVAIEAYQIAIEKELGQEKAYDELIILYEELLNSCIENKETDTIREYFELLAQLCDKAFENTGKVRYQEKGDKYSSEKEALDVQTKASLILCRKVIVRTPEGTTEYEYNYDENNKLVKAPALNTNRGFTGWTEYYYTSDGKLYKSEYTGIGPIDEGFSSTCEYDDKGNIVKDIFYNQKVNETHITEYKYTYDDKDRIITCMVYGDGRLSQEQNYTYDEDGNVILDGQGVGNNSSMHTEKKGNVTTSVFYNGSEVAWTIVQEEDYIGNKYSSTTYGPDGAEEVHYDFIFEYIQ